MKHYIDKNETIFAFEEDGSQDHLITNDMTKISKKKVDEKTKAKAAEPNLFTYKTDIWQRVTDDEAETLDAHLTQATAKQRRMWDDSLRVEHSSDYFSALRKQMVAEFGDSRTSEILAPSN